MIVKVTRGGSSFKGAFQYYLHDKGTDTCNRIAWVHTENLRTVDPEKAWKHMAYTARAQGRLKEASGQSRAGRKLEKPVFAFSLAWHPEQSPEPQHKLETARAAIRMLGLEEHEAVIVAHRDEPQKHVHVIVNRVHPLTGLAGDIRNSKRKFSDFSREYERTQGKIYCEQRETNFQERQKGNKTRYCDPVIVEAWETTTTGPAFVAALKAKGYSIEEGRKRLIVIDPHGKAHNPTRHLKGVRAADIQERLNTFEKAESQRADELAARNAELARQEEEKQKATLEQLAKLRLDALNEKHRLESERLVLQQSHRILSARSRLAAFYRLPEQKAALIELNRKIQKAPWWKRVIGIAQKDRKALYEQAQAYKRDVRLYREKIAAIVEQDNKSLSELKERQGSEQKELQEHIARQLDGCDNNKISLLEHTKDSSLSRMFGNVSVSPNLTLADDPKKDKERRTNSRSQSYPSKDSSL